MIASGSHVPGIDWESFGLPAGTALRYERPAEPLRRYFPSYAVLDSDMRIFNGPNSWLLPGGAKIWIVLAEAPITARVRNRVYAPLGAAVLYGPTSRAIPITSNGGVSIVVDVGPLGWARWFDRSAEEYRDRITPLEELWSAERVETLIARLHASDRGAEVKPILDAFLLDDMPPPAASEALIAHATVHLADPALTGSGQVAQALGIGPQALLRQCRRNFGFGAKLMIRRRRFLRALIPMLVAETPSGESVPAGYHDMPHFVRDGKDLLGVTPRQLLQMDMAYLRAALRARAAIIGAPWAMLDIPNGA
jgi:AraC-like DNA-binding protein